MQSGDNGISAVFACVDPPVSGLPPVHGPGYFAQTSSSLPSFQKLSGDLHALWLSVEANRFALLILLLLILGCLALLALAIFFVLRLRTKRRLAQLTYRDQLTGYDNYAAFAQKAPKLLASGGRYAFVLFDINRFKAINNTYGFQEGNCLLLLVSQQLEEFIGTAELFARSSDDNFALLLRYTGRAQLTQRLNELFVKMRFFYSARKKLEYQINYACGVYFIAAPGQSLEYCHESAQMAKRSVKELYDTAIVFYDESLRKQIVEKQEIETSMYSALQNHEFEVYLQPKYDLASDCIAGAEALTRWHHPTMGFLSPARFIPILERNGFLLQLDCYVTEVVCRTIRAWMDAGVTPVPVSVNMSRLHVKQHDFIDRIEQTVRRYNVPPELVEIELTETAFHDDTQQIIDVMEQLKSKGFRLAMDDFGSGYSSLNLLNVLPVDVIKLDRMMFNDLESRDRTKKIVTNAIHIVRDLEMTAVAEGIETQEQINFLKDIKCDMVQGYFYAKPMSVCDFELLAFSRVISKPPPKSSAAKPV